MEVQVPPDCRCIAAVLNEREGRRGHPPPRGGGQRIEGRKASFHNALGDWRRQPYDELGQMVVGDHQLGAVGKLERARGEPPRQRQPIDRDVGADRRSAAAGGGADQVTSTRGPRRRA